MLLDTTIRRLNKLGELSMQGKRVNGLFRLMENPELWIRAYAKIYPNKGAITRGVDGTTMDGFSDERAINVIKLLKEGRYRFKPVRRTYIPKANGKMRPLGISSGDDKLVEEVMRIVLEQIYEPIFCDSSHGFRPKRSCHTALTAIQRTWTSVKWIIDMDIKGYYDNINHDIMIKMLEKRIDDKRFLKLIKAILKAGYLEDWKFHGTYSGTPQGGIISPVLANIYLHELDEFVDKLKLKFNKGKKRRENPEYLRYSYKMKKTRKEYDRQKDTDSPENLKAIRNELKEYDKERKKLPAGDPRDENYRRLFYCRYADDFVFGIIGTKDEARNILEEIKDFIQKELKLQIAEQKSGIRHAGEPTRFLGYDLRVYSDHKVVKTTREGRYTTAKSMCERMQLHIPEEKLRKFCHLKGYGNYDTFVPLHRTKLLELSDAEIIKAYNAEIRGIANFYGIANSPKKRLSRIVGMSWGSLMKTLAYKHKSSVAKMARKLKTAEGRYVLTVSSEKKLHTFPIFRLKDFEPRKRIYTEIDHLPNTLIYTNSRTELVKRMDAMKCEYCGKEKGYFEVHHVGKLKNVLNGKRLWQRIMITRQRKTMVLCVECHHLLHSGKLPDWKAAKSVGSGEPDEGKLSRPVRRGDDG